MTSPNIPGYLYGSDLLDPSPVSLEEFEKLKQSVMWSEEDAAHLRRAAQLLEPKIEEILDLWYGFVGSQPHLLAAFCGPDGLPNHQYLAAVRARFGQWIRDTCTRPYDQAWLAWQQEIGRRHHRQKKNRTDGVTAAETVPLRFLIALIYPIVATIRTFLTSDDLSEDQIDRMHAAWFKSVVMQVALWARAYAGPDDW